MAKDDMLARHKELILDCTKPNPAVSGPEHSRTAAQIEMSRQTLLLAAILEKLHAG